MGVNFVPVYDKIYVLEYMIYVITSRVATVLVMVYIGVAFSTLQT